jgi:general secretion pathway protein J
MNQKKNFLAPCAGRLFNPVGFTLFEILVAIFIFSIIATAVFGLYPSVFSSAKIIDEIITNQRMGQTCLTRMTDDLESAFITMPPLYRPNDFIDTPDPYRFFGNQTLIEGVEYSKLRFTSLVNVPFDSPVSEGISEIIYYIQTGIDGHQVLKRGTKQFPSLFSNRELTIDPILCEKVNAFKLRYVDDTGMRHDRWDSDSQDFLYATPTAIDVSLEIGEPSKSQHFSTTITMAVSREKKDQ